MVTGFCAWSFQGKSNIAYEDSFVERFKFLIDRFGLKLSDGKTLTADQLRDVAQSETPLSHDIWGNSGYSFIQIDRKALCRLVSGEAVFSKNETEALEALCGDFFCLNGFPKFGSNAASLIKTS